MSQRTGDNASSGRKLRQTVMGQFLSNPKSKGDKSKTKSKSKVEETKPKLKKEPTSVKRKVTGAGMFTSFWTRGAHRDTEEYRLGYPGKPDHEYWDENYHFYTNRSRSQPDGDFIDKIHAQWYGDYKLLERHHGYIQWLFPIREEGMNWNAQALQLHEIEKIKSDRRAIKRVVKSYRMMLDFYGMVLKDEKTGQIERAENWNERFRHLNRSYHNYLRITRILKSLGEFGYEHLKANFVRFVLTEGMIENTLPNLVDSCVKYWIGVLRDDTERDEVFAYYEQLCEVPECDKRPRTRSPSPEFHYMPTAGATARSRQSIKKKKDDEFSDEDDGTLEYAMTLIDDSDDEEESSLAENGESDKVVNEKGAAMQKPEMRVRTDHQLSDSDTDDFKTPEILDSQEADYWKKELEDVAPSLDEEQAPNSSLSGTHDGVGTEEAKADVGNTERDSDTNSKGKNGKFSSLETASDEVIETEDKECVGNAAGEDKSIKLSNSEATSDEVIETEDKECGGDAAGEDKSIKISNSKATADDMTDDKDKDSIHNTNGGNKNENLTSLKTSSSEVTDNTATSKQENTQESDKILAETGENTKIDGTEICEDVIVKNSVSVSTDKDQSTKTKDAENCDEEDMDTS